MPWLRPKTKQDLFENHDMPWLRPKKHDLCESQSHDVPWIGLALACLGLDWLSQCYTLDLIGLADPRHTLALFYNRLAKACLGSTTIPPSYGAHAGG
jgi:hypothetical protein